MSSAKTIATNFWNGFLVGFGSVLITAFFGFLVGSIAVLQGNQISTDFESNLPGLIGLVVFSIGFWGIPTGMVGGLVFTVLAVVVELAHSLEQRIRLFAVAVTLCLWILAAQLPTLPFRDAISQPIKDIASIAILGVYFVSTLVMAFILGGRIRTARNQQTNSIRAGTL